jgi:ligand-binding sensor domain-containing protein
VTWVGTQGGLAAFDGERAALVGPGGVRAIARDPDGRLWLASTGGGWVLDDGGTPLDPSDDVSTLFSTADGLPSSYLGGVALDRDGNKWFASDGGGLAVLEDGGTPHDKTDDRWTAFGPADGLAGERLHAVAVDRAGVVWATHENDGLSALDFGGTPNDKSDDRWATFGEADGLAGSSAYSIVVDAAGRKWVGACGGVSVLDDGGTATVTTDDRWATFDVGDCNPGLAIDGAGAKWIATGWSGVARLDDGGTPYDPADDRRTIYRSADGLVDDRAHSIAAGADGVVWVGASGGLAAIDAPASRPTIFLPLTLDTARPDTALGPGSASPPSP